LWPPRDPSSIVDAPIAAAPPVFSSRDPSSVWDAPPSLVQKAPALAAPPHAPDVAPQVIGAVQLASRSVAPPRSAALPSLPPPSIAPPSIAPPRAPVMTPRPSAPKPASRRPGDRGGHALEGLELTSLANPAEKAKLDDFDIAKSVALGALWRPQPATAAAGTRGLTLDDDPASIGLRDIAPSASEQAAALALDVDSRPAPPRGAARPSSRAPRAPAEPARHAADARPIPSTRAAAHEGPIRSVRAAALPASAAAPGASASAIKPTVGVAQRDMRFVARADLRSFWEAIPDAFRVPFSGPGPYWICASLVWALVSAGLWVLSTSMAFFPRVIPFVALVALLAMNCDYYRVCLWVPASGEDAVDRAPSGDVVRLFQSYVKSGAHLAVFLLLTNALALAHVQGSYDGGEDLAAVLHERKTWLLLSPALYWPMAVGLTALGNDFAAIWSVPSGLRALVRAPLEYIAILVIGALTLAATWGGLLLGARALFGLSPALAVATLGVPLALTHGVLGALMGHLVRARGEAFE
jgi:hypothetical protein